MDEQNFWVRLEFRIGPSSADSTTKHLRAIWCDGLVAEDYDFSAPQPCIRGRAGCGLSDKEPWRFTLIVNPRTRSPEEIDWSALMPSDRSTGWLLPDLRARAMTMNPLSGYPD